MQTTLQETSNLICHSTALNAASHLTSFIFQMDLLRKVPWMTKWKIYKPGVQVSDHKQNQTQFAMGSDGGGVFSNSDMPSDCTPSENVYKMFCVCILLLLGVQICCLSF